MHREPLGANDDTLGAWYNATIPFDSLTIGVRYQVRILAAKFADAAALATMSTNLKQAINDVKLDKTRRMFGISDAQYRTTSTTFFRRTLHPTAGRVIALPLDGTVAITTFRFFQVWEAEGECSHDFEYLHIPNLQRFHDIVGDLTNVRHTTHTEIDGSMGLPYSMIPVRFYFTNYLNN